MPVPGVQPPGRSRSRLSGRGCLYALTTRVRLLEILPSLRDAAIAQLVRATRLSERYSSLIRLGKRVPHPRHWDALRRIGDEAGGEVCLDGSLARAKR